MKIAFVLWHGEIGGAERVTAALAGELRRRAVDVEVLFVGPEQHLGRALSADGVAHQSLELERGGQMLFHPMRLRRAMQRLRPDVVITVAIGYIGAMLRGVGFRGPIIGVEHGALIPLASNVWFRNAPRWLDRLSGVVTYDAEVAISEYMLRLVEWKVHAPRVVLIPHGVRVDGVVPAAEANASGALTVGYAGRLVPGKGIDRLLRAVAILASRRAGRPLFVRIAGDGPMRPSWEALARELGIGDRVDFVGWTDDIGGHWRRCQLCVAPNDELPESFCMSVLEAMGAGRPAIVSDLGALPELIVPNTNGHVVPPADEAALADALAGYLDSPDRLAREGVAAYRRAAADYSLARSAERYLTLANELADAASRARKRRAR